jgi:hypothetical protein
MYIKYLIVIQIEMKKAVFSFLMVLAVMDKQKRSFTFNSGEVSFQAIKSG